MTTEACLNTLLQTYLHSYFWEIDLHGQLFSTVHIGVVGFLKSSFQLMQLVSGEGGPVTTVFLLGLVIF